MNTIHSETELEVYLQGREVRYRLLSDLERKAVEEQWKSIFGLAFQGRPRLRRGAKAEHEYQQVECSRFLIVPFSSNIPGIPMRVTTGTMPSLECWGTLPPLGQFCPEEFFVSPPDFLWTMVHTHEDHGFGGPYFLLKAWIP